MFKKIAQLGRKKEDTNYVNKSVSQMAEQDNYGAEDYVHLSSIILKKAYNFSNPQHREIMAQNNIWLKSMTKKVAEEITAEAPVFASKETINDEEPKINKRITKFWDDNRLTEMLRKSVEKARKHGWCIYYPVNKDALFKGYSGPAWHIYTRDEATPYEFVQGHPVRWNIKPSNPNVDGFMLSIDQCVFFDPENTDDFDGMPVGSASWDKMIDWECIWDAINGFDQRLGNGFLSVIAPGSTSAAELTTIRNAIKNIRTRKGLVIRGGVTKDESAEIVYTGMGGAQVDFTSHLEKLEEGFVQDLKFPKAWFLGDAPGALESGGQDTFKINKQLKQIFNQWIPFIKLVLKFHGLITNDSDIEIKQGFTLDLSEQERIQLDQIKTQTIAAKSWLTQDEKRELDGYPPMTEEQKQDMMDNQFSFNFNSDQQQQNTDKQKSDEKQNDSNNKNVQSNPKIPKNDSKTLKFDDLFIKTDSIQISENLYEIQDVPLVLPQEKFYPEYNTTCVRSADEIAKMFNDPKTPKEFRIGVTATDDHSSKVPLEILKANAVGIAQLTRIDEQGNLRGNIKVDLSSTENILGKDNWLKQTLLNNENPHTSVALYSRDENHEGMAIERDLDVRSFVFTRNPRNQNAGV